MKLSMWIFADWLKGYQPELNIREGGLEIETVRLFSSNMSPAEAADNVLYIGRLQDWFVQGDNSVICAHKNDIILLPTEDVDEIMNQILNAFEYYQSWNVRMLEAISADCRPAEVLAIADEVIQEPIYLLDSNQYALALSTAFGAGEVNPYWDKLMETGTTDIEFLARINREVPDHFKTHGLYRFSADFLEQSSYNYNMHLDGQWIGLSSMVERTPPMPQYKLDLFHIFCQNLELWYLSHSREQQTLVIDSLFREALLHDAPANEAFLRRCRLHFPDPKADYYVLALTTTKEQTLLMSHVCKEINLAFSESLAVIHQNDICVLFNDSQKKGDSCFDELIPLLKRNGFYGGYSTSFSDLNELFTHYQEALFVKEKITAERFGSGFELPGPDQNSASDSTMQTGVKDIRRFSGSVPSKTSGARPVLCGFSEYALTYALREIRTHMSVNLIHPAVLRLVEYDRAHNTVFAETLHIYLEKERSQSRTAEALSLHRNTLTYRLQRIRELLPADLEDDDTRLHLLLSFRFLAES